jgi:alanyl-tRNA synthetase
MKASEIRQSFLSFFKEKQHTLVPSDNVGYTSRDGARIFTNAGMNQFVPIFLGERPADVDTWPGVLHKALPTRAADTQKCIRAGGKHNDLEDVGFDTYHHTFFEMLGNWSFGDYFKKEAISWAWELVIERWKFPASRLYATIYQPDASKGDPAERDQEAWDMWAEKFRSVGLDPNIHIVNGNKKDNFWMMADTGPCGPCTELHVDLTPGPVELDTQRQIQGASLVNIGTSDCIEIWNNVFIQYNANVDGSFSPLPAKHVDTGMGFERVCSIMQGTKQFTDFENARISNYDTDVFTPIFAELSKACGKTYQSTLPKPNSSGQVIPKTEQEKIDVAFRIIGDHLRTLSIAIADGILPGNSDRNYTLRRILRRAVKYGRTLEFKEPFMHRLVDVLVRQLGDVFPELIQKSETIKNTLKLEEESFNRTLDKGIALFEQAAATGDISGEIAFKLYDQEGFPLDLTELMAREKGRKVDTAAFEALMQEQRRRGAEDRARKKQVVTTSEIQTKTSTPFHGFEKNQLDINVLEVIQIKGENAVILDQTVCYAEMGGQVGDQGQLQFGNQIYTIKNTSKLGNTFLHFLNEEDSPETGLSGSLILNQSRRKAIERHHTATHLLHWAIHQVVSTEATQKGSSVNPDRLTFDFNSAALTSAQLRDIEKLVNERILENEIVSWSEIPYTQVKQNQGIMQLFGEKYGDLVRVVQIGGTAHQLNGWSMELCGGTHVRSTGELGHFRLSSEGAVAAGIRRIEACAGHISHQRYTHELDLLKKVSSKLAAQHIDDIEKKIDSLLEQHSALEKQFHASLQREASQKAKEILSSNQNTPHLTINLGNYEGDHALILLDQLKINFNGVIILTGHNNEQCYLLVQVPTSCQSQWQAGKLVQELAPIIGGKGGGKPDFARGGGKDKSKLDELISKANILLKLN